MAKKMKGGPQNVKEPAPLPPVKTTDVIEELNYLEATYGRLVRAKTERYLVPGEANARIDALKELLDRLNVRIKWTGDRYQLDEGDEH